jgi:hypothetical protein
MLTTLIRWILAKISAANIESETPNCTTGPRRFVLPCTAMISYI